MYMYGKSYYFEHRPDIDSLTRTERHGKLGGNNGNLDMACFFSRLNHNSIDGLLPCSIAIVNKYNITFFLKFFPSIGSFHLVGKKQNQ